jgi:leucyl-tRNA synthetase
MAERNFKKYEPKWQKAWEAEGIYRAKDPSELRITNNELRDSKFYGLIEFPYPSGAGLHVGHPRSYTAIDAICRKKRMEGRNVLYPIGWDAFGLPTENYAIKNKVKPQEATAENIANFRRQLKSIGFGFDWSREVNTTDPEYYKWTQWQFLKFFDSWYDRMESRARPIKELPIPKHIEARGELAVREYTNAHRMAYKATSEINWCPNCKIGLANEEAVGGVCERCGGPVEKREKRQWMIRITEYAERLLQDLETVDYLEQIKAQQVNWIGRSEGASINFETTSNHLVNVFTTRPDTLFGATYLVLSPEHELVTEWLHGALIENENDVVEYRKTSAAKTEIERTNADKTKTGVKLEGVEAKHPATGELLPIWISDYVLAGYGTGAIMAVPAHDERDYAFAKEFGLPIKMVVCPHYPEPTCPVLEEAFVGEGHNVDSDFLNGLPTWKAKDDMISWLEEQEKGRRAVTYKLRDWVFSRQRYWGEPIPIIHCENCGMVPAVLPVLLPEVEKYEPTDSGESPLAAIRDWVEVECPDCGGKAERETDTMPNWAGSSWYFLRYTDPKNDNALADPEKLKYWIPVDLYNGGMEHTTLHLLYSRFWHKFLWDVGVVPMECGSEPYRVRRSHGLILAEGGEKMSKSKGNVVNPDEIIDQYGADVFRLYEMFMGPFDQPVPWDVNGIEGVRKFLDKVWNLCTNNENRITNSDSDSETLYHQTVKKITDGIDNLQFNTCVSQLMILTNAFQDHGSIPENMKEGFLKILAPFAPHVAEELWRSLGRKESIHVSGWPSYDESKLVGETFELVIQINGKVRDTVTVPSDISEEEAKERALASEKARAYIEGKDIKKIIYIKGKMVAVAV